MPLVDNQHRYVPWTVPPTHRISRNLNLFLPLEQLFFSDTSTLNRLLFGLLVLWGFLNFLLKSRKNQHPAIPPSVPGYTCRALPNDRQATCKILVVTELFKFSQSPQTSSLWTLRYLVITWYHFRQTLYHKQDFVAHCRETRNLPHHLQTPWSQRSYINFPCIDAFPLVSKHFLPNSPGDILQNVCPC